MEMSVHLEVSACFSEGKQPALLLEQEDGKAQDLFWVL
jgi:hypothetical protein